MKTGVDDILGVDPEVLVRDVLEAKVGSFVLDRDDGSCQRAGSWGGKDRGVRERVFKNGDDQADVWLREKLGLKISSTRQTEP
jgi:hypothetical protein